MLFIQYCAYIFSINNTVKGNLLSKYQNSSNDNLDEQIRLFRNYMKNVAIKSRDSKTDLHNYEKMLILVNNITKSLNEKIYKVNCKTEDFFKSNPKNLDKLGGNKTKSFMWFSDK